jgi:hypothetical protein
VKVRENCLLGCACVCLRLPVTIDINTNRFDFFLNPLTFLTSLALSLFVPHNCVRNCAQPLFRRTLI